MPPELATLPTLSPALPTAFHRADSHTRERYYLCIHAIRRATLARPPAAAATSRCRYFTLPAKLPPLHAARQAAATSRCPSSCRHFTLPAKLPLLHADRRVAATSRRRNIKPPVKLPLLHAARQAAATSRRPSNCRHFTPPVKLPPVKLPTHHVASCRHFTSPPHHATRQAAAAPRCRYVTLPGKLLLCLSLLASALAPTCSLAVALHLPAG